MFEDLRVTAGQVIVDEAMVLARTEEDQLELAVRQHAQLVYRIAYSVLRNHHDAEDATQETFVRVLRAKRKLSSVDDPQKWLARIAWRVAVERRKRPSDISVQETVELVSRLRTTEKSADEAMIAQEAAAILERMIPSLPRRLRDVLTLSTVEEMSPADVASILKISEAAVRSRLFRARGILREKMTALLVKSDDNER
jgi:RNA polymerase sigma-70 factor (ECF subfamily)